MMRAQKAALGFRAHSGWTAMIALGGSADAPSVVLRRRIELCNRGVSREGQPYHAAAEGILPLPEAQTFLEECAATAAGMAQIGVRDALAELDRKGYKALGSCVLTASGRPLPELAKILGAHPLIHTAEGEFFRKAVRDGCGACGVKSRVVKEREVADETARTLSIEPAELARRIAGFGKLIGPPWRQDEKLSALAAWLVLAYL